MNVLVTGATGFIGHHLVARLLGVGDRVRALVRPGTDASDLTAVGVEIVRGDLANRELLAEAVAGCELVYHLAKAHSGSSHRTIREVNVGGTANMAWAVRRAGAVRFVHASSAAVYGGIRPNLTLGEGSPLRPDSEYARSKARAEQALRSEHLRFELPVVVGRITGVLGPRTTRWRSLFTAIATHRLWLPGRGMNRHHLADVSDITEGLLLCGRTPRIEGGIYNLAGNEPVELWELVKLIAGELGVAGDPPKSLPGGPCRIYHRLSNHLSRIAGFNLPRADGLAALMSDRVLDISKARQELGYTPRVSVPDAIQRTAQWYRTEGYLPLTRPTVAESPARASL